MEKLKIYSIVITLALLLALGYIFYSKVVVDPALANDGIDMTEYYALRLIASDAIADADSLRNAFKNYQNEKHDSIIIKWKEKKSSVAFVSPDSNAIILSGIFTEIDSVYQRQFGYSLK
jgi:hypothetical protein